VQPARHIRARAKSPGPPRQHQKRRLSRVLGFVRVAQRSKTRPPNHRGMTLRQFRKGGFIALCRIPRQQFRVALQGHVRDSSFFIQPCIGRHSAIFSG
jgi:hypothetical protein